MKSIASVIVCILLLTVGLFMEDPRQTLVLLSSSTWVAYVTSLFKGPNYLDSFPLTSKCAQSRFVILHWIINLIIITGQDSFFILRTRLKLTYYNLGFTFSHSFSEHEECYRKCSRYFHNIHVFSLNLAVQSMCNLVNKCNIYRYVILWDDNEYWCCVPCTGLTC